MMDHMEQMDEEEFDAYFADSRTWTTTLSDGSSVNLKPDLPDPDTVVSYTDRLEYSKLVQQTRMNECNKQVSTCSVALGLIHTGRATQANIT